MNVHLEHYDKAIAGARVKIHQLEATIKTLEYLKAEAEAAFEDLAKSRPNGALIVAKDEIEKWAAESAKAVRRSQRSQARGAVEKPT